MNKRIHLDVLGGIAGDMFVSAVLDIYPELAKECFLIVNKVLKNELELSHIPHKDGISTGSRFIVNLEGHETEKSNTGSTHTHRHWSDIRKSILNADIPDTTRQHALGIFKGLAEAEAKCHGIEVDKVSFHEVGAWDSIADILAAAYLIDSLGEATWTMSTLPTGSGKIPSAHGLLPVPVPAVVHLLKNYNFVDDGIEGERITPTGASILKYLNPSQEPTKGELRLIECGVGFGTKVLPGLSNICRLLIYEEPVSINKLYDNDSVINLQFDIDDQSPEDLSVGLERIRATPGVIDVNHTLAVGKKGRLVITIQVLAQLEAKENAIEACFNETTTLGLRCAVEERMILRRELVETQNGNKVKVAQRPGGLTAKIEMDDLEAVEGGHSQRQRVRELAEDESLSKIKKIG